ncbi:hypothetical protein FIBSPDRAFT_675775, partial [Athelia psychrophila]
VLPYCFIPHSTHLCQPLDVLIFSMMQREYSKLVFEQTRLNIRINKTLFSSLLEKVRDSILTPSTIVKSFETCGLRPI